MLDHHLYRCFTDEDKCKTGTDHANNLRSGFRGRFAQQCEAAKGSFVVGEWSASLDPRSFPNGMPDGEKDAQRRAFVQAQLELFESHAAGYWFWTYKKGEGWDAGWSATNASQAEILPGWVGSRQFKGAPPSHIKDQELQNGHSKFSKSPSAHRRNEKALTELALYHLESHADYWAANGGSPNPNMYAPGFSQGWDDALIFLSAQGSPSEMGFVHQWAVRRQAEFESQGHKLGRAAWEWEHGFKQGVEACARCCLA